jgi:Tfp pilus assembly PilM family ATPase
MVHGFGSPVAQRPLNMAKTGKSMQPYLALELEKHELSGLCAHFARGTVQVTHSFVLRWPQGTDPQEQPDKAGQWLREELDRRGIRGKYVLAALPRDEVVMRRLAVPPTTDKLLPGLVRYQAGTTSSVPLEQLVLDFLPLPPGALSEECGVLTATISRQRIDQLAALTRAAGLELIFAGIGSLAELELVARVEQRRQCDPNGTSLLVTRRGTRVEVSLMQDRHVVLTHATGLSPEVAQQPGRAILGEVSRALMAAEPGLESVEVQRAWLLGGPDESGDLREALQEHVRCEVSFVHALEELDVAAASGDGDNILGRHAAALGLLLARRESQLCHALDFLHPRQPAARGTHRPWKWALLAAAAVATVAAGWTAHYLYLRTLDNRIQQQLSREQELDLLLKQGEPVRRAAGSIGEWEKRNLNWLEQMAAVSDCLPAEDRLYFENWRMQLSVGQAAGRLEADGYARERADVEQMNEELADQPGYQVRPQEIQSGASYQKYPIQFEIDVDLSPQQATRTPGT